ncbi:MAG: DUF2281 domain-containing protein [Okeania sp. SIO3C4]|nr:DUF2281 domain-containing protein [Okeania sp. SIO3C4]
MKSIENVKEELQRRIEKLPEHKIPEVLQFVNFLLYSQEQLFSPPFDTKEALKESDPLADFIGAVECGSLAQNIDSELYGE